MNSRATYMDRILYATIAGLFLLSGAILVAACGGGGNSAASGSTRGVITGFGSVFVNGVEFQTNDLTHRRRLDDGPGDIPGKDNEVFRKGMIVTLIHGSDDMAEEIEFEDNLEGPAENVSASGFDVLGQLVAIDNGTTIEGVALANGAIVEVSGLSDASGTIHATFIEVKPAGSKTTFEIKGFVSSLDTSAKTFRLGPVPGTATITVSYAGAQLSDLPGGALSDGLFVEVKTSSTTAPVTATSVEGKADIGHAEDHVGPHA